jgi:hypothetical protein
LTQIGERAGTFCALALACTIAMSHEKLPDDIYNWFTGGFDTADLKEAKALLNSS